jgi:hypothetical protein
MINIKIEDRYVRCTFAEKRIVDRLLIAILDEPKKSIIEEYEDVIFTMYENNSQIEFYEDIDKDVDFYSLAPKLKNKKKKK